MNKPIIKIYKEIDIIKSLNDELFSNLKIIDKDGVVNYKNEVLFDSCELIKIDFTQYKIKLTPTF